MSFRLRDLDWVLLSALGLLAVGSLLLLASTAPDLFWKQFMWYAIAFTIIVFGLAMARKPAMVSGRVVLACRVSPSYFKFSVAYDSWREELACCWWHTIRTG